MRPWPALPSISARFPRIQCYDLVKEGLRPGRVFLVLIHKFGATTASSPYAISSPPVPRALHPPPSSADIGCRRALHTVAPGGAALPDKALDLGELPASLGFREQRRLAVL